MDRSGDDASGEATTRKAPTPKASDALPLLLYLTNAVFFMLFLCCDLEDDAGEADVVAESRSQNHHPHHDFIIEQPIPQLIVDPNPLVLSHSSEKDKKIVQSVVNGTIPSYSLESMLGDGKYSMAIRHKAIQRMSGRSLQGLPLDGFNYNSILGQCCEILVSYMQIPVGVAGPLLLDGFEYTIPMATTEGCLVASTNRGYKAIYASGGAISVLLRDGMTRAPVVRFATVKRAAELKFYLEDPLNLDTLVSFSIGSF